MTDDERQKLCAALRAQISGGWFYLDSEDACHGIVRPMGEVAAEEIERLAALAQSDAEPVAWQWRAKYTNGWSKWTEASEDVAKRNGSQDQCEYRALYTAPPRPDASAGLIEAAEWHEAAMKETMIPQKIMVHKAAAAHFRARAADRSGK